MLATAAAVVALAIAGCGGPKDEGVTTAQVDAAEEAQLQYPGSTVVKREVDAEWQGGAFFVVEGHVNAARAGAYMKAPPGVGEEGILDFYRQELDRRGWTLCAERPGGARGALQFCRGPREVMEVGFTDPDSDAAGVGPGLAYYAFYYLTSTRCRPSELSCPPPENRR